MIKKGLLGVATLILFLLGIVFLSATYNQALQPPQLVTNFVDLDKVQEISLYRSCTGHTVVPQDKREMKRNMKHYVKLYPQYKKEDTVEVYAPYDGTIALLREDLEHGLQGEIWIAQDRGVFFLLPPLGLWMVNFEHVRPLSDLKYGSKVKTGELVGYASFIGNEYDPTFDVVYAKIGIPPRRIDNWTSPFADLDSVFNHMDENVLAEYEERGATKENIILSKEERDANPCEYRDDGPYFEPSGRLPNWIPLE